MFCHKGRRRPVPHPRRPAAPRRATTKKVSGAVSCVLLRCRFRACGTVVWDRIRSDGTPSLSARTVDTCACAHATTDTTTKKIASGVVPSLSLSLSLSRRLSRRPSRERARPSRRPSRRLSRRTSRRPLRRTSRRTSRRPSHRRLSCRLSRRRLRRYVTLLSAPLCCYATYLPYVGYRYTTGTLPTWCILDIVLSIFLASLRFLGLGHPSMDFSAYIFDGLLCLGLSCRRATS